MECKNGILAGNIRLDKYYDCDIDTVASDYLSRYKLDASLKDDLIKRINEAEGPR